MVNTPIKVNFIKNISLHLPTIYNFIISSIYSIIIFYAFQNLFNLFASLYVQNEIAYYLYISLNYQDYLYYYYFLYSNAISFFVMFSVIMTIIGLSKIKEKSEKKIVNSIYLLFLIVLNLSTYVFQSIQMTSSNYYLILSYDFFSYVIKVLFLIEILTLIMNVKNKYKNNIVLAFSVILLLMVFVIW